MVDLPEDHIVLSSPLRTHKGGVVMLWEESWMVG